MLTASARALWPFFVRFSASSAAWIAPHAGVLRTLATADHSPAMIADVDILSFGPRGRLPAGAWLSGLTRAR